MRTLHALLAFTAVLGSLGEAPERGELERRFGPPRYDPILPMAQADADRLFAAEQRRLRKNARRKREALRCAEGGR